MTAGLFFRLKSVAFPELREGFALDTLALEKEMQTRTGIEPLSNPISAPVLDRSYLYLRDRVPFFYNDGGLQDEKDQKALIELAKKYPQAMPPCSMEVNSLEELAEHMFIAYQTSYFHYILGKGFNVKNSFPKNCCGLSSWSLFASLLEFGYVNTVIFRSKYDHAYVLIPFVMRSDDQEEVSGSIVIDPTYDQLYSNCNTRNAVFLKLGARWNYQTEWKQGGDLFPKTLVSVETIAKNNLPLKYTDCHQGGEDYLKKAFSNPVSLQYFISWNFLICIKSICFLAHRKLCFLVLTVVIIN